MRHALFDQSDPMASPAEDSPTDDLQFASPFKAQTRAVVVRHDAMGASASVSVSDAAPMDEEFEHEHVGFGHDGLTLGFHSPGAQLVFSTRPRAIEPRQLVRSQGLLESEAAIQAAAVAERTQTMLSSVDSGLLMHRTRSVAWTHGNRLVVPSDPLASGQGGTTPGISFHRTSSLLS
jgi:hypothetical protein